MEDAWPLQAELSIFPAGLTWVESGSSINFTVLPLEAMQFVPQRLRGFDNGSMIFNLTQSKFVWGHPVANASPLQTELSEFSCRAYMG